MEMWIDQEDDHDTVRRVERVMEVVLGKKGGVSYRRSSRHQSWHDGEAYRS